MPLKDPEKRRAYTREYLRKWRKNNPEKQKVIAQRYRENHREETRKMTREQMRRWREVPENRERMQNARYRHKYGIDLDAKRAKAAAQNWLCGVCQQDLGSDETRWHLDHDHDTKQVRDVLCGLCNQGLGLFKESIERLRLAINYLERYGK